MRIAPATGVERPALAPDVEPEIPIFIPPPETDQAPRTIEEEIKIREEQGLPVPPTSPTTFPSSSPPIVPSSGGGWAFAAAVAAYLFFG